MDRTQAYQNLCSQLGDLNQQLKRAERAVERTKRNIEQVQAALDAIERVTELELSAIRAKETQDAHPTAPATPAAEHPIADRPTAT